MLLLLFAFGSVARFAALTLGVLSLASHFEQTGAKLLTSPEQLAKRQYDFIIIGAGTAGNVLANRLTANPNIAVLVVEAGISNANNLDIVVPFLGVTAVGTSVDWNYTTTPQVGLNNRTMPFTRGFVLGGSSSINLMAWTRGSNDVWDNWAEITKDEGWSWKNVEPYYLKTWHMEPSTNQVSDSSQPSGPVDVGLPEFPFELDDRVFNTSKALGGRFSFVEDLNSGNSLGFSYVQSSIGKGERSSSATAFLEPVLSRPNLDVLITTHATRLITSLSSKSKLPAFRTVELAQTATGPRINVTATKEIILCSGVVGTPQLLLLSGIGPKEELAKVNVASVVDLPDVGKRLVDHTLVPNYYSVNSTSTFDDVFRNQTVFNQDLNEWMSAKTGLFTDSPGNTFGFMRLPPDFPSLKQQPNPASGPLSGNTELIFVNGFAPLSNVPPPATGNFLTVISAVVSPTSRGTITLASPDPFVQPNIDVGLFTTDFDMLTMVQAMKDIEQFIGTEFWKDYIIGPFGDLAKATTDNAKMEFIRKIGVTVNHPVGTASMSPRLATWGVTDPDLLIKGTSGLRIVDASVFPQIPECHTQAVVYTVAERAADLIIHAYGIA
ncbi:GMC oxidoreductase [Amanita thiersii Skay4041]|uniref:GMC oxidoreductase n=1 Tax=Amanita thiersii Skay4041 TaxID=703135 RepID=A0A2A9N9B7_9AGAR|nr:GMC oxidoreductase [Amanita thiersii Skay4041]